MEACIVRLLRLRVRKAASDLVLLRWLCRRSLLLLLWEILAHLPHVG